MPVFDMIETVMVKKWHFRPTRMLRFIVRNLYVGKQSNWLFQICRNRANEMKNYMFFVSAATMFVGITFPFFGGLLGFFGGLAFAPTTYFVSLHPFFWIKN